MIEQSYEQHSIDEKKLRINGEYGNGTDIDLHLCIKLIYHMQTLHHSQKTSIDLYTLQIGELLILCVLIQTPDKAYDELYTRLITCTDDEIQQSLAEIMYSYSDQIQYESLIRIEQMNAEITDGISRYWIEICDTEVKTQCQCIMKKCI